MTGRRAAIFLMLAAVAAACPTGDPHDGDQDIANYKPATTSMVDSPAAVDPAGGDITNTTPEDSAAATTPPLEDTCYETFTDFYLYTA